MKRGNIFWGSMLVILGVLFFLQAQGMLTDAFGWFWPIFLMLLGVWVLTDRFFPTWGGISTEPFSIDLQGAAKVALAFDHGMGSVQFTGGAPAGVGVCGAKATGMEVSSSLNGETLGVNIQAGPSVLPFIGPSGGVWQFQLTQEVPVSIKVDAGATSLDFDLTDVKLAFLGVDMGASSLRVKLPAQAGPTTLVDVESGAASLDFSVPQGVAARIRFKQGASSNSIDQARFPLTDGGLYQSPDFDSAANKVEINLEGGANSVSVH
jgi:hypothetical protein